jgi:hypothetical protein
MVLAVVAAQLSRRCWYRLLVLMQRYFWMACRSFCPLTCVLGRRLVVMVPVLRAALGGCAALVAGS